MPRAILIVALLAALAVATWNVLAQPDRGTRFSLSGGGGLSSGDRFTLDGYISRPDAGRPLKGGTFALQGGFQAGAPNPRLQVCGDLNNDGTANILDAIIGLKIIVGLIDPTETQKALGDVVRDGEINIFDVNYIVRYVLGLVSGISGCGLATPQVRVMEVPNLVITGDDPILQGERLDPEIVLGGLPPTPLEFKDRGAHDLFEETRWTFVEEIELGPGQSHDASVSIAQPVLLQARATWFGALVPMEMEVRLDGTPLAMGTAHPSPPNRGTITADVRIGSPGSATVSVTNGGSAPVGLQMIIGVLPRSVVE